MACFTVPLATAAVSFAAKGAVRKSPFARQLGTLGKMMLGGSAVLAVEHVVSGEVVFAPPFLTAVKNGETAEMLHEMATTGVAMTVLTGVAWAVLAVLSSRRRLDFSGWLSTLLLATWGTALMWSVDTGDIVLGCTSFILGLAAVFSRGRANVQAAAQRS